MVPMSRPLLSHQVSRIFFVPADNIDQCSNSSNSVQNYIGRLEREGIRRVKMFVIMLVAYLVFWGPLFSVTLLQPSKSVLRTILIPSDTQFNYETLYIRPM